MPIMNQKEMPLEQGLPKLVSLMNWILLVSRKLYVIPHIMTIIFSHQLYSNNLTDLLKLNLCPASVAHLLGINL